MKNLDIVKQATKEYNEFKDEIFRFKAVYEEVNILTEDFFSSLPENIRPHLLDKFYKDFQVEKSRQKQVIHEVSERLINFMDEHAEMEHVLDEICTELIISLSLNGDIGIDKSVDSKDNGYGVVTSATVKGAFYGGRFVFSKSWSRGEESFNDSWLLSSYLELQLGTLVKEALYIPLDGFFASNFLKNRVPLPVNEKVQWLGSASQLGYIFYELASKGYIQMPFFRGEQSYTGYAKILLEHFDVRKKDGSALEPSHLKNEISPETSSLRKFGSDSLFVIPDINRTK